jgi:SAM-dependent methyltransferase
VGRSVATTDIYEALAPIYDAWQASAGLTPFALVVEEKLRPLLEREASGATARPLSFLDLGCGTGTLLHALGAAHPDWRLTGVDASPAMLAVAAAKPQPPSAAAPISWTSAPLDRPLPVAGPFDAAGAFYDTLNHLADVAALRRALAAAARVLRPGGLLVFDLTNHLGFQNWWRGRSDFRAATWQLTIDARFDERSSRGAASVRITSPRSSGRFQLIERLFEDEEVLSGLAAAGLTVEGKEPWCPFEMDVPGKTWWIARKA